MSRRGERIEFRPEEQACCRRLSALGVADMDHIVADGRGDVWLVEVMSKTMVGRDDVANKCARKAAHTLLMLGAAMGPLHWGDDLPVAGLDGGDQRLRLAFVVQVQAE